MHLFQNSYYVESNFETGPHLEAIGIAVDVLTSNEFRDSDSVLMPPDSNLNRIHKTPKIFKIS